jgi:hypothetical protein
MATTAGASCVWTASTGFGPAAGFTSAVAARGGRTGASMSEMEGRGAGVEPAADPAALALPAFAFAFAFVPGVGSVPLVSWIDPPSTFGVASAIAPGRGRLL